MTLGDVRSWAWSTSEDNPLCWLQQAVLWHSDPCDTRCDYWLQLCSLPPGI